MASETESRKVQDLQKVLQITRAMAATEDLDGLLGLIVDRGMELLDAERATVFLYDADRDELVSRIAAGTGEIRIPAGSGIAGAAARGGKVVDVPDAYADGRFNPAVDQQTGFRTRNILAVPMRGYDGDLVGVLQVLNSRRRPGEFAEYDITLAETLAAQAGVAIQRARLIEHYLQKQQMERAMKIAQDIQQGLLPKASPAIDGFDVCGFSKPADQTGGDTYDFMALPDGRWMFIVADATGHGIGPALVIAETRAMLRAICLQASGRGGPAGSDISAVLRTTNDLLAADLQAGRFVTCFFGLLDPHKATLTYASAGHGPMLFYDRKAEAFRQEPATSIPLGVLEQADYSQTVLHAFAPGDFAVILTDGFYEAAGPQGQEFGIERAMHLLLQSPDLPAAAMIETLRKAVSDFTACQPQADDLTAVIIRKL